MMDESTELSVSITQIVQRLKGTHLHSQLEKQAKECMHKPEIKLETLKDDVRRLLKASGWERKLQNAVYRELHIQPPPGNPRAPSEHTKEPLAYMRKAQLSWEKRILKSLNSMCTELGIPLARKRPVLEQKELTNKWNEMGTDEPDLSKFRPVYAPKDFLEVLIGLRNLNNDRSEDLTVRSNWGLIQVSLNVRDIPQMRETYPELGLTYGQLGIDDHTHVPPDLFESEHILIGKKVVSEQDSAAAQQYSRQGCPTGLRAQLWTLILNTTDDPEVITHYEQLKARVIHHGLLVDNLIYKDVKLTASNDDYYFVFEDYLYQVLLCFSRDTAVLEHFNYNSATPPKSRIQSKSGSEQCAVVYPPNGVIPFHGFSILHSISSHPSGIVSLCLQFERLLQTHLPQLFYHLREIGAQPLRIAFKWIVRAFSGYLSTDQLLLLWDRILGYGSLELVAVLAAAVFAFRAENLMEVTSLASAEAVLADLSTLKVMPLLQIFLFATSV
ncbi:TBC1 domain family member 19 isoform X2 [Ctenopharyngodon idella]|uniref:TBC1 domain family member 19 isoform X2 n=1 Tax=Ctenopharyngodon idella TaxID=7959 RepID=UPI00222F63DB|nr:TBC1 domain family member 19 isoform X2 [Ctenopharyngodon idella]